MKIINPISSILLIVILFTSCVSYDKLKYLSNLEPHESTVYNNERKSKSIRNFDVLYIKVLSTDEKTSKIFTPESNMNSGGLGYLISYTVNEKGAIYFPFVGEIVVKDLTLEQASGKIQTALSQYLLNTAVIVQFMNNHVTVVGEVNSEGDFTFTSDKVTIFQAIGMAKGIKYFGDRNKVTVIRTVDSKITYNFVDLSDKNIVESKFYYVEPNDVIVVKPRKSITRTFQNYTYSTVLSTVSALITVLVFIKNY
jgi:polysaccharide biosynthesis/export protein